MLNNLILTALVSFEYLILAAMFAGLKKQHTVRHLYEGREYKFDKDDKIGCWLFGLLWCVTVPTVTAFKTLGLIWRFSGRYLHILLKRVMDEAGSQPVNKQELSEDFPVATAVFNNRDTI